MMFDIDFVWEFLCTFTVVLVFIEIAFGDHLMGLKGARGSVVG
jgi:hypothetical protein